MRLGLGELRLPPAQFWAMTPLELITAAGLSTAGSGDGGPGQADLEALMRAFPDATTGSV